MDEKQHFRNCCKELGIDCDTYIKLGAGNPKNPTRFIFQSDHTKRKDTQLFAVKYFEQEDVYIAWNLKERGGSGKNSFSLSKNKIKELKAEQVLAISKGLGYPNWDRETIFAFKPNAVLRFLKVYIVSRI